MVDAHLVAAGCSVMTDWIHLTNRQLLVLGHRHALPFLCVHHKCFIKKNKHISAIMVSSVNFFHLQLH